MTRTPGRHNQARNTAIAKYGGGYSWASNGRKAKYLEDPARAQQGEVPGRMKQAMEMIV